MKATRVMQPPVCSSLFSSIFPLSGQVQGQTGSRPDTQSQGWGNCWGFVVVAVVSFFYKLTQARAARDVGL